MNKMISHIFDSGNCITSEALKAYAAKKLSSEEMHQVEQHLMDCGFCADALEGYEIALEQNVNTDKVLLDLFSKIDNHKDKKKPFNYTYLYAAAASIVIILGVVFLFQITMKETKNTLSENIVKYQEAEKSSAQENANKSAAITADSLNYNSEQNKKSGEVGSAEKKPEGVSVQNPDVPKSLMFDNDQSVLLNIAGKSEINDKEEGIVADFVSENSISTTGGFYKESANEETQKISDGTGVTTTSTVATKTDGDVSLENKISKTVSKGKNSDEKNSKKDNLKKDDRNVAQGGFSDIDKVAADSISVSAGDYLATAFEKYKQQDYEAALDIMDESLENFPDDYNTLYYSGLSNFYLKKYTNAIACFDKVILSQTLTFKENAMWFKALSLIEQGKTADAKTQLNEIILMNGSFKTQAQQKLDALK